MLVFKLYQCAFFVGLLFGLVLYSVLSYRILRPIYCDEDEIEGSSEGSRSKRYLEIICQRKVNSLCSNRATLVGAGQKVISFSLYVKGKESQSNVEYVRWRYAYNLRENLNQMRQLYPGWLMRVYTDIYDESGSLFQSFLEEKDFFICNTTQIPELGDVTHVDEKVWRFLPIGDPTVNTFIVRDLDSMLNTRERSAVKQWETSNKIFHTMRDHPLHKAYVLGGLWGSKNYLLPNTIRQAFLGIYLEVRIPSGLNDQDLLGATIYLFYKSDFMIHDSYLCNFIHNESSIPFPEQRTDLVYFVGSVYAPLQPSHVTVAECPIECRPKYGQDWTYC